ncbi:MAG: hypothetical protein QF464_03415 [Myxococcota bacterium]|jgi:hypothetical protein|nr:hypothetical protein [Myxococcota bacterium]
MAWMIVALFLTLHEPVEVVRDVGEPHIRCFADTECGQGDCWRGFCEDAGYCIAYYTCV